MLVFLWIAAALCHGVASNSIFQGTEVGSMLPDVVYKIGDMSKIKVKDWQIKEAITWLTDSTCLNFIDYKDAPPGKAVDLPIEDRDNCEYTKGVFEIGNCIKSRYYIVHEIGHFLGLYHTYTRPDWKNYIRLVPAINEEDAKRKEEYFKKVSCPTCYSSPVVPFDYGSGMHQKLGNRFEPLDGAYNATLGQSVRFSFTDFHTLNWLFNCSGNCETQPKCENGGYTHPRNCKICMCNKYYTGELCQKPRNLVKLTCEGNRTHSWNFSYRKTDTKLPILNDDFQDRGENVWDLVEAPENMKLHVEAGATANQWDSDVSCGPFALEINDGDLNMVGRMFCTDGITGLKMHNFTAKSNLVGLHAEFSRNATFTYMKATFSLLGCDGAPPETTTTTSAPTTTVTSPPPTTPPPTTTTTVTSTTTSTTAVPITTTAQNPSTTTPNPEVTTTKASTTDGAWCEA